MCRTSWAFAAVFAFISASVVAPGPARAEDLLDALSGQKPKPFIDPAGYWAAILPTGFNCQARARHVECRGNRGADALLTVDVADVPSSATAELVALNQLDRFKQKPHFQLIDKQKAQLDGSPSIVMSFRYDHLGNVQRRVGVQALYMVRGGKQYTIHLEAPLAAFGLYQADLKQLLDSFHPARVDAGGNPIVEDLKPKNVDDGSGLPDVNKALKGGRF